VAAFAATSTLDRRFVVVAPNNSVTEAIRIATREDPRFEFNPTMDPSCSAAILDPPWYLPAYEFMLARCATFCAQHSMLFLSVPSEATRPSARMDGRQIVRLAVRAGFEVDERRGGALRYQTPIFEAAALEAAGIAGPPAWRRSDLVVLRRMNGPSAVPSATESRKAFELTLRGARIRVQLQGSGGRSLTAIADGEVFPSVSARAAGRSRATLWTTTNRAFEIDPAHGVVSLARVAQHHGLLLPQGLSARLKRMGAPGYVDPIQSLTQEVAQLVEREIAEAARLSGGAATWLATANDARFLSD
jgi:hypothetical protein